MQRGDARRMARALHATATVAPPTIGADAPLASIALLALGLAFHVAGSMLLLVNAPPFAALHAFAAFIVLAVVAALHQLLPVLLGVSALPWKLTLGTGISFTCGFALLIVGFFGAPTFVAAALVLASTAVLWCVAVLTRIVAARMEHFTAVAIGIAICSFGIAAWLGAIMARDLAREHALPLLLPSIHGSMMLLLFASLLVVTLSYRFVPMFALAHANAYGRRGLLLVVVAVLLAAVMLPDRRPAFATAAVAFAIIGYQHLQTLHHRIRAKLDMSLVFAATAWVLAVVDATAAAFFGITAVTASALLALTVLGWISITIFGYGMKIVGFLAWQFARSQTLNASLSPLRDAIPIGLASYALGTLTVGALAIAGSRIAGSVVLQTISEALYAIGSCLYATTLTRIASPYLRART